MKLPQIPIIATSLIIGLILCIIVIQSLQNSGPAKVSSSQRESTGENSSGTIGFSVKSHLLGRAPNHNEDRKSEEIKSVEKYDGDHGRFAEVFEFVGCGTYGLFDRLAASPSETWQIIGILEMSKNEIYTAENNHVKLGKIMPDDITLDVSAMKEPAAAIKSRLQERIRSALPVEISDKLISIIKWEDFYPVDEKSFIHLVVARNGSTDLVAKEISPRRSFHMSLDEIFPADGSSLPADQIFRDRWKPLLKGITILPKSEK